MNYDHTNLIIRIYDTMFLGEGDPVEIHVLSDLGLPAGQIKDIVQEALMKYEYRDGYSLDYTVSQYEHGASASGEELVLELLKWMASGAGMGLARYLIEHFTRKR